MKYSPFKICLYIVLALLVLLGMTYLSTSKKLDSGKYQEGFFIGDITIKYPKSTSFLMQAADDKSNIKSLDSLVENIENSIKDEDSDAATFVKIPNLKKLDTSKIQRIAYPKNRHAIIAQLREDLQSNQCRIIHYGDSQLEGDRISAYLRNRLQ